jgi:hypothetical protein
MTSQHSQSVSFRFDEAKSFSENCEAFLLSLGEIDADMAVILRDNWDALVAIVRDGERDAKARGALNTKVAMALDSFAMPDNQKGGA